MHPVSLDKNSSVPLSHQLYEAIKQSIFSGKLRENDPLPASRILSSELGVSRNTVMHAYEQLLIEGYLVSRIGSGTFVAEGISFFPHEKHRTVGKSIAITKEEKRKCIDFDIVTPDWEHFPISKWRNCLINSSDRLGRHYDYTDPSGIRDFRVCIAEMLRKRKGLITSPDHIVITTGTLAGIKAVARFLRPMESHLIVEDPCYRSISSCLRELNYELHAISVDKQGLITDPSWLHRLTGPVLVTPSSHFPSGAILPVRRRLDLIEYARQKQTYVIENDYNSDFHYTPMPVQSMHFLDSGHVIHVGTFSETMFPSLRLGYVVLPTNLLSDFTTFYKKELLEISSLAQLAMTTFIETGEYERHLFRMKNHYNRKRNHLVSELKRLFKEEVEISGDFSGLFLVVDFKNRMFDPSFTSSMEQKGILVDTYVTYTEACSQATSKLLLGFGSIPFEQITPGLELLKSGITE